ncbi:UDP-N-acetylglucosamine 2-epimerase [Devosia limi DSM 17137]|uniref:UDP-N-acetylglucosamine 2-epimerase n=1 Tax=Devosia limi DSM 17137 TaxID=1121477 RepID=A0A0F5LAM7_9HYPH|nr:UDP-N-acetylglucosamine 2-epimerase (non-hydrolyzing) [Devosia limi]KKB79398.1 UDP-N-acetylglucosamine 2-epimerase [Devosia limi DSM 17137]SHF31775.1 UDP-N-acetylglucosamine 2-epimerase (non-hydrolysing) [Devosia limi DSM 17137]
MLIDIIAGARPNFMKIATILRALDARQGAERLLDYRLIHTGQHYDPRMSGEFFAQLGIPEPDINMGVGSGTQAEQTGAIMVAYEKVLSERRSDLCLVVGDVTSTMACAITAQKLGVKVAHVEAGIRSGDWRMPEEINRLATDAITNWFFTTSTFADDNLCRSGVPQDRIFFVGNTMIDTLLANQQKFQEPDFWAVNGLSRGNYLVLTLHRPSNVDDFAGFSELLGAIGAAANSMPIVFPVHPRTAKNLANIPNISPSFILVDPQPYLEFNFLVQNAKAVITDSGGITEETTVMGVPCLTLRDTTERPETVTIGTNELIGTDPAAIGPALERVFSGQWKKGGIPEKWDGGTGERIVATLERLLTP